MTDTPVHVGEVLRLEERGELMLAVVRAAWADGLVLAPIGWGGCFALSWFDLGRRFEVGKLRLGRVW